MLEALCQHHAVLNRASAQRTLDLRQELVVAQLRLVVEPEHGADGRFEVLVRERRGERRIRRGGG